MALAPGQRFGQYDIVDQIGSGGMGEVWHATDTTLERDVAIKVLPESFASDADRVARFEQEAKTLASLNHPNIAQVHGLEKSDGTMAIVMELVEGPTLADRIAEGPLPADEALGIALQIADALEAAHSRGIVHRDLKPANIKLKPDGTVKVLDFGIAKALAPELTTDSPSPIMTTPVTQIGVILGTAAYMSPEQARGKPVDQRTDIWAFGCLLYEMLTGQLAFGGEDVAVIMARVIANDTNMDSLPGMISPAVRHTIKLCLEKDPARRIADIRDVRLALQGVFETAVAAAGPGAPERSALSRTLPVAAALAAGIVVTYAVLQLTDTAEPQPVNRFDYDVAADLIYRRTGRSIMAFDPNGRSFVLNTTRGLFLRRMGELEARLIPGTEEDLTSPAFSPDGQNLAYYVNGNFKRIAISGGAPVNIATNIDNPYGVRWETDGYIYLGQDDGIARLPASGGEAQTIFPVLDAELLDGPQLLPDGDSVLFSSTRAGNWDTAEIVVGSIATGERTVVFRGGSDARYLPSGHLVYAYEDDLLAVAFDLDELAVSGGPVSLESGLARAAANLTASANYDIANDGTLIYVTGGLSLAEGSLSLAWVDAEGNETGIGMAPCTCVDISLSPDGTRVAMEEIGADSQGGGDIWIWSFETENKTRLTFENGFEDGGIWTPDSRTIIYHSTSEGMVSRAADGTGTVELLHEVRSEPLYPFAIDDDGFIVHSIGQADIYRFDPESGDEPAPLLVSEFTEKRPALSPDGRWLAYESDETGTLEIYVRPYPDVDSGKWQVSGGGGTLPQWSADGSELYYISPTHMMVAVVETESSFRRRTPEQLFPIEGYYQSAAEDRTYAVGAENRRFLMIRRGISGETVDPSKVIIVENFVDELQRLVPTD